MSHIAVIGAGLSGLTIAQALHTDHHVDVFEKARGVSGRMSTRYADPHQFDHGAQFFTARSDTFSAFLQPYINNGVVSEWNPRITTLQYGEKSYKRDWFEPHYVATPKMNSLCKAMAGGLNIHLRTHIETMSHDGRTWQLTDKEGTQHRGYDWIICTAPSPQCSALLPQSFNGHTILDRVTMTGCYSLMVGTNTPLSLPYDVAIVKESPISWIAVNSSKPGRTEHRYSLLVQSSNDWAETHIDEDVPEMEQLLLAELSNVLDITLPDDCYVSTHRWRYANVAEPAKQEFLLDRSLQIAACGDWCIDGRVEGAFLSASALAAQLHQIL